MSRVGASRVRRVCEDALRRGAAEDPRRPQRKPAQPVRQRRLDAPYYAARSHLVIQRKTSRAEVALNLAHTSPVPHVLFLVGALKPIATPLPLLPLDFL